MVYRDSMSCPCSNSSIAAILEQLRNLCDASSLTVVYIKHALEVTKGRASSDLFPHLLRIASLIWSNFPQEVAPHSVQGVQLCVLVAVLVPLIVPLQLEPPSLVVLLVPRGPPPQTIIYVSRSSIVGAQHSYLIVTWAHSTVP